MYFLENRKNHKSFNSHIKTSSEKYMLNYLASMLAPRPPKYPKFYIFLFYLWGNVRKEEKIIFKHDYFVKITQKSKLEVVPSGVEIFIISIQRTD